MGVSKGLALWLVLFVLFIRDQSATCQSSIFMTFAAHTKLKCTAHEWENQNIWEEEHWMTLSTGELICSGMQQPKKSKEVTHVE